MANVVIKGVSDDALARLERYAANKGVTLEEHLREWLEQSARMTLDIERARLAADQWQAKLKSSDPFNSTELIAEDRRQ